MTYEEAIRAGGVEDKGPLTYEEAVKMGGTDLDRGAVDKARDAALAVWDYAKRVADHATRATGDPFMSIPVDDLTMPAPAPVPAQDPSSFDISPPPGMDPGLANERIKRLAEERAQGTPHATSMEALAKEGWILNPSSRMPTEKEREIDVPLPPDEMLASHQPTAPPQITTGKPMGPIESLLRPTELSPEDKAKSTNIIALSQMTKLPPSFVQENYDAVTKKFAGRGTPTMGELASVMMTLGISAGLATAPLSTAVGLGTFMGAKEAESLATQSLSGEDLKLGAGRELKELAGELRAPIASAVEAAEVAIPGIVAGGAIKGGRGALEWLTGKHWWNKLRGNETGLVRLTAQELIDAGYSEADLSRMSQNYWKEAAARRSRGEYPIPPEQVDPEVTPPVAPGPTPAPEAPRAPEAPPPPKVAPSPTPEGTEQAVGRKPTPAPVVAPHPEALPRPLPSDRWTADRGAIPGEPAYFLDGETVEDAKAAIVENEETGQWQARTPYGIELSGWKDFEEAALDAEKYVDSRDEEGIRDDVDDSDPFSGMTDEEYAAGGFGEKKPPAQGSLEGVKPDFQLAPPEAPAETPVGEKGAQTLDEAIAAGGVEEAAPEEEAPHATGTTALALKVKESLNKREDIPTTTLFKWATEAFGGKQAEGKFTPKDAFDAMELGVNMKISDIIGNSLNLDAKKAKVMISDLKRMMDHLPTQTKRTEELDKMQQFSTPPPLVYVANWVANLRKDDLYLEPSAGIGGLAVFAKQADVSRIVVNELSKRRADILENLDFAAVYREDAEQLHNILPKDVRPTVVVMNPPFSAAGERMPGKMILETGAKHIEQALKRLEPNGRLVAIVGRGMGMDSPTFLKWWGNIKKNYNVRANVLVSGKEYTKYGTSFDNRILVIDKTGATEKAPITGEVGQVEDLIGLLEGVKHERPSVVPTRTPERKPVAPEQAVPSRPGEGEGEARPVPSLQPPVGGTGPGEGVVSAPGTGVRSDRVPDVRVETGKSPTAVGEQRPGGGERIATEGEAKSPGDRVSDLAGSGEQVVPTERVELPDVAPEGLEVEVGKRKEAEEELSDSIFEPYRPQKVKIPGAKDHPGKLVESAAMSIVEPPTPTARPKIPKEIIDSGKISAAQLEPIVYAKQAHEEILPGTEFRKGYFVGDGTGVGKGRIISGIFLDNWNEGRKKGVWISANTPLIEDAKRDVKGIGWNEKVIFPLQKIKMGAKIQTKEGILFAGYDLLKSKKKSKIAGAEPEAARLEQVVEWLGPDFDGVIAYDESHNMGNAIAVKGMRGMTKPAEKAIAGMELARRLPKARVVYVSATGATEVMNLAYADRLGLWGEGTPFANKSDFINQISSGGIAAMEIVARDMKGMGNYLARSLSYEDVSYERLEHDVTPEQRDIYDELARAWQLVSKDIHAALKLTTGDPRGRPNGKQRANAMSMFWGAHQRFFNQIITSFQTPAVIKAMEKDFAAGHSAVIQLVNTNAAIQDRALSRLEEDQELEDLDMTPREQLMEFIRNSFPVAQYENYVDDDGNVVSRPVVDSHGNPVENADAVAMREALLDKLGGIKVPSGPMEMLLDHFGVDQLAEVTGRQRRVVLDETGKKIVQKWSQAKAMADADAFASDKKKGLIFSYAGGTGRSYHPDLGIKNQRLRRHYLLQPGWRADRAIQGFGRTHRTNQKQAPEYVLVTTNLKGQKRFISSIARRLDQLGALTRGQRQTGGQGFFTARDNLESQYARDALRNLMEDIYRRAIPGWSMGEFESRTGLRLTDSDGNLLSTTIEMTQFMNRLLSLEIDKQNELFDLFSERMDRHIAKAIEDGTLDVGMETLKAKKIEKAGEQVVYTDKTGAETKYIELDVTQDNYLVKFDTARKNYGKGGFVQNVKSKRVYALSDKRTKTNEHGTVLDYHGLTSVDVRRHNVSVEDIANEKKFRKLSMQEAEGLWGKEYDDAPKEVKHREHMITGALLPIWDRLTGHPRIVRAQTVSGERLLGRIVNPQDVDTTLRRLGATKTAMKMGAEEAHKLVLSEGFNIELSNQWEIIRSRVSGEPRIELVGPDYKNYDELKRKGAFIERISYSSRVFIPSGVEGVKTLEGIIESRPIVSATPPAKSRTRGLLGDEAGFLDLGPIFDLTKELAEAYRRPPVASSMKKIIGKYTGTLQINDFNLAKTAKMINEALPKDRQVAITNYIQAGGDLNLLRERASKSKAEYAEGYAAASNLSPEELAWAKDIRKRQDEVWKAAADAGVLEAYFDNYVRGEWERPTKVLGKLYSQINAGMLNTKPREAMKKVFDSYFDGEQAGFKPKDKRIGYQMIAMERSLRQAIAARKAMASMMASKEKDGRPSVIVGGGGGYLRVAKAEDEKLPFLVKPNIKPKGADTSGYRYIDHPALRKWKWIGKDVGGNPILLEGNMWAHPDAYGRINALLGTSKIRSYTVPERVPVVGGFQPGKFMLKAGAFIKGTILVGPFHQFHVGEHALFHKVNPFRAPEIDFDARPILKEGVEHGLMLYNHNALFEFGEGLATGGLWHRVPILGDYLLRYQEYLFQDYIPRLKAAMFEAAVVRAEKYYAKQLASGEITRGQLLENAAKQANAAFGEQNYRYIGRNPTFQDLLRIGLLAPDFLEARLKFAGQAVRPYGREQLYALIRGAIIMALSTSILNALFGDRKWHWDRPFSFFYGGREYTPRSVVGDIFHLIKDPRSFWYHRLNPLWGRPPVEIISGEDRFGRKVTTEEAAKDILGSWVPIPAQGLVRQSPGEDVIDAIGDSLLQSIGISNYPYRSDAMKKVYKLSPRVDRPMTKEQKHHMYLKNRAVNLLRKGKSWGELPDKMKQDLLRSFSDEKLMAIQKEAGISELTARFKRLSIDQKISVWKVATPEERAEMSVAYDAALERAIKGMAPEDLDELKKKVQDAE